MFSALLSFLSANVLLFILHIDGNSSFPKPLSAKEERAVLERLQDGDPAARATLIERNLRLVSHIVKKYYSRTNDTEDLVSIGTIGLIKAIDSFDPSKGTRLATYASRCIENEILMYFRAQRKTSGEVHLGDAIEIDKDGNPLSWTATTPCRSTGIWSRSWSKKSDGKRCAATLKPCRRGGSGKFWCCATVWTIKNR